MNHIALPAQGHRDGEFTFSTTKDGWTPCSPLEDFLLTFGVFVMCVAPMLAFIYWMVA